MARDLLELVVEGPEGDVIWDVYQDSVETGNDVDEEEMERMLGPEGA
jgi:hypothetical protein